MALRQVEYPERPLSTNFAIGLRSTSCTKSSVERTGCMQAELRALLTVEHSPIDVLKPEGDAFSFWLRALVGTAGAPGEETFDFQVCSPAWLTKELEQRRVLPGGVMLIVQSFDPKEIELYVQKRIAQATGENWITVAQKLAQWSIWEFDDYCT